MRVVDVSDPQLPIEVGYYVISGFSGSVDVVENIIYVAAGDAGLVILRFLSERSDTYEGWEIIGHLSCNQLAEYEWAWNQAGSGEYEATTPIFGVYPVVIYLPEVKEVCPNFSP